MGNKSYLNTVPITKTLLFFSIILMVACVNQSSVKKIAKIHEYSNVGLIIDRIEKTTEYPSEWRQSGYRYSSSKEGYIYYVVHFTIEKIDNIHIVSLGGKNDEKSSLLDTQGNKYRLGTYNVNGWSFVEPDKGFASPKELVQGANGILTFSLPNNVHAEKLSFIYYFKRSWDDKERKAGKVNIALTP